MPKPDSTLKEAVAIVGMGGVFPGARTLEEFWSIIEQGRDMSQPVPAGRWILNPSQIYNPTIGAPDSVYTDRACFIEGFELNRKGINLTPDFLESLDPSVHLLLEAGRNALAGAKMDSVDKSRIGVIVGNIVLPTENISKLSAQAVPVPLVPSVPCLHCLAVPQRRCRKCSSGAKHNLSASSPIATMAVITPST